MWPRTPKTKLSRVGITVKGCYFILTNSISMCWNTLSIIGSSNRMVTSVQRGIKLGSEASKQPDLSQSWVSHESVTSDFWGCYYRAPIGHEGVIFLNETLESPSGEWIEHVWTLFWVKQGIWIFGNFGGEPPINKAHQIMTYLTLLLFPTIMSWLLTKLANVSHDLTCQWEWNHFWLAVRHHPRKHCKKKKKAGWPSKSKDQGQRKRLCTPTYLLPVALIAFKVGYQAKNFVCSGIYDSPFYLHSDSWALQ